MDDLKYLILILVTLYGFVNSNQNASMEDFEKEIDEMAEQRHVFSSGVLMIFLVPIICLIWCKIVLRYFHIGFLTESGISMIIGILIGLILKSYEVKTEGSSTLSINTTASKPPEFIELTMNKISLLYGFKGEKSKGKDNNEFTDKAMFDPEIFMYVLLPPIMFNTGLHIPKKYFIRNFGTIMIFAFPVTITASFIFGGLIYAYTLFDKSMSLYNVGGVEPFLYGALISSTDPVSVLAVFSDLNVDPDLNSIVIGESSLNDAASLVLYRAIEKFLGDDTNKNLTIKKILFSAGEFLGVFMASLSIGFVVALLTSLMTKCFDFKKYPILECAIVILMSYSTFLIGEACNMSGIVAILFCGLFQANYTNRNLSHEAKLGISQFSELLNFFSENFVFSYIGMSVFLFNDHKWHTGFIFWSFFSLLIARSFTVYFFGFLVKKFRNRKLPMSYLHLLVFAGLRGAVSFALAIRNTSTDVRALILTTTMLIVLFTVIFCGSSTIYVIKFLKIPCGNVHGSIIETSNNDEIEPINSYKDLNFFVRSLKRLDNEYLRPFFTIDGPSISYFCPTSLQHCCVSISSYFRSKKSTNMDDTIKNMWGGLRLSSNEKSNSYTQFNNTLVLSNSHMLENTDEISLNLLPTNKKQ